MVVNIDGLQNGHTAQKESKMNETQREFLVFQRRQPLEGRINQSVRPVEYHGDMYSLFRRRFD
jgi:hypothetical protein